MHSTIGAPEHKYDGGRVRSQPRGHGQTDTDWMV